MSPWAFHPHLAAWAVVVAVGLSYLALVHRGLRAHLGGQHAHADEASMRPTPRQWWQLAGGLVGLAAAVTWPVADLAAHWSLTALLVQRLLLMLVVAPLLLLAVPVPVWARLTRPPVVDAAVDFLSRVPVAIVTFTVIVVGTLTVPAVAAQSSSAGWRALFDALLLFAGFVLWVPALGRVPGARRPSSVGRAVYLVVQSILPNFPAVVFVFSRHPLYSAFVHAHRAIAISALNDQQLAGIVAKVGTLPVLWTAAWRALSRAERTERLGVDEEPLTWAEVERALQREERAERRSGRPAAG
ncbi:MAG TPA: cytochrome c oxidase assembly protein [Acidimicrobiales bacterium]|nr:cytochrome c oxidase assembly protein [Acidimicrobiales bacterium]